MTVTTPRAQTIPPGEPDAVQGRHVVGALVVDRPGTLNRVSGLLRARSFNIESLTVGATEVPGRSRMTIVLRGDEGHLRQVLAQLERLIEVLEVADLHGVPHLELELALVEIAAPATPTAERSLTTVLTEAGGAVLDSGADPWRASLTASPERIDAALDELRRHGLRGFVRAGAVAVPLSTKNGATPE